MSKHTPTPWIVDVDRVIYQRTDNPARILVADCPAIENAEHIVRCVNSYEALVKSLRKITNLEHKLYGTDWEEITEAQEIAASALIAAGEQP